MNHHRIAFALALATALGVGAALAAPEDWLQYFFWGSGLVSLVFGSLAASSARDEVESALAPVAKVVLWFVVGIERPMARIKDMEALMFFFGSLAFLAGLTIGAFVAVNA